MRYFILSKDSLSFDVSVIHAAEWNILLQYIIINCNKL